MSKDRPLVSILIPCFNAERWIAQAIESALAQTWSPTEVIVVDDGSSDGSREIIAGFGDRIRHEFGLNRGGNAARNRLMELSCGDWLQFLDADDYLLPGKIESQMGSTDDCDLVYGPSLIEDESGRRELPIPDAGGDPWRLLSRWHLPQTGSPLWRKQAIVDAGGWSEKQPCCQEHELYFRMLKTGARFSYCAEAGSVYRKWSNTTVCERDPRLVRHERIQIKRSIARHLDSIGELNPGRLAAINQSRFEIARSSWSSDRRFANLIIREIHRSHRDFRPAGDAGPKLYSIAYRTLGFGFAERLAALVRP